MYFYDKYTKISKPINVTMNYSFLTIKRLFSDLITTNQQLKITLLIKNSFNSNLFLKQRIYKS